MDVMEKQRKGSDSMNTMRYYTEIFVKLHPALSIKNHRIDEEIPWSQGCTRKNVGYLAAKAAQRHFPGLGYGCYSKRKREKLIDQVNSLLRLIVKMTSF